MDANTGTRPSRRIRPSVLHLVGWGILIAATVLLFGVCKTRWDLAVPPPPSAFDRGRPESLETLLNLDPEDLGNVDIARMNLLCASGLPGAEKLDVAACLNQLDQWTDRVRAETMRHLYRFRSNPANYNDSEGYFRILMLVTVLQQDFGVRYNPARIRQVDFRQSKDLFLHGLVGDVNGGTCVSLPVVYAAVARRLGYPVKLVLTRAHVFCRWDSPAERFNIEATNQGTSTFPDAYYKTWPEKLTDAQVAANRYLISLSPAEELATFLASRGHCLLDTGYPREALSAYAAASALAPESPAYAAWQRQAGRRLAPSALSSQLLYDDLPLPPRSRGPDVQTLNEFNRRWMKTLTRPPAQPRPPGQ